MGSPGPGGYDTTGGPRGDDMSIVNDEEGRHLRQSGGECRTGLWRSGVVDEKECRCFEQ